MNALGSGGIYLFEGFRLDRRSRNLFRLDQAGTAVRVELGRRALDLLSLLVERRGELVSKGAIMAAVWPGRVVEEANLNVQISKLRDILGHGCIQTVTGRGYRFVAPVIQPDADARAAVPAISQSSTGPRPHLSIVVLPFANSSDDREQQYFADGITVGLTTDLSRIADTLVISRHTAFTYWHKPVDTKQIGRELGVRYVLEGTVRRSGNQVRVNAQLIDAETDTHLWTERFDRDTGDPLPLQNEITSRIAVALNLDLASTEAVGPTENSDAQDCIFADAQQVGGSPHG